MLKGNPIRWIVAFLLLAKARSTRPNVVILLADNLGYEDVSFFGNSTSTPNIDRLGKEGMALYNWNSAAHLCSASRASLLTGRYPIRSGIYPGVFHVDAANGLLPHEPTLPKYLQEAGYATSIIGKWHLGHRDEYLPTKHGFDDWFGVPYHMSGGSLDNHTCFADVNHTMWLPLYDGTAIVEQPLDLRNLASKYADRAERFLRNSHAQQRPFFLYMSFSHVHQLCAPRDWPEQATCQWGSQHGTDTSFVDAVTEMDWIAGRILDTLDELGATNNTLVLFTADNGPWVAEQSCSGRKGPFLGHWLQENSDPKCAACPHDYKSSPTADRPRRCVLEGTSQSLDGVPCGADTGLGSIWEANLRMPAMARWPGRIAAQSSSYDLVSTLDILPTVLSALNVDWKREVDGIDIGPILFETADAIEDDRVLYFWRDGFVEGPLPPPYGRMDVVAVKVGRIKLWYWTKSAHYNEDEEVYHNPPLLFDTLTDPAEAHPLDPKDYKDLIARVETLVKEHKDGIGWTIPLTLAKDPKYIPCVDRSTGCRTSDVQVVEAN